jgi:hypothetical protein
MTNDTFSNTLLTEFEDDELSLLETVDHILNKGVVIAGEITISVAKVDLVYLGVNILLGSIDTIDRVLSERAPK